MIHVSGRFLRFVALLVVLGGIGAGLLLVQSRWRTIPAKEIPRNQVTLRNGQWYRLQDTRPFTGVIVETYESGALKSQVAVSNGLLEGLSEGWFTNGQRQVQEIFRAGISHGLRTKWHANGRKMSQVLVVNGKLEGIFRRWSEDGTLSEEIEMKDGAADGNARAYNPDGSLRAQARMVKGRLLEQKLWAPGERKS